MQQKVSSSQEWTVMTKPDQPYSKLNWLNLRSVTNYIKEFKELGNFIVRDRVKSFENKCKDKEDAKLAEILIKSTSGYYINRAIKVLKNERAKGREDGCLKILTEIFTKK